MNHFYFPVFMNLSKKKVLIIGGGTIATRRVCSLLTFVESIEVVAPTVTTDLQQLIDEKRVIWNCECYCKRYIEDKDIVIAATNQQDVNLQVYKDCKEYEKVTGKHIMINVADNKDLCDFYFPSLVKNEDVVIGINSGGQNPSYTKQIRKQIETVLDTNTLYKE